MGCSRASFAVYSAELCGKRGELDRKVCFSESTAYNERTFSQEKSERPEKVIFAITNHKLINKFSKANLWLNWGWDKICLVSRIFLKTLARFIFKFFEKSERR